jgi:hypothetical protein
MRVPRVRQDGAAHLRLTCVQGVLWDRPQTERQRNAVADQRVQPEGSERGETCTEVLHEPIPVCTAPHLEVVLTLAQPAGGILATSMDRGT